MACISVSRLGKCSSDRLRPRDPKASTHVIPLSSSCIPLRIVLRFQPNFRSARLAPPGPNALTVRARNRRRALPLSCLAALINRSFNPSVSPIFFLQTCSVWSIPYSLGYFNLFASLILQIVLFLLYSPVLLSQGPQLQRREGVSQVRGRRQWPAKPRHR